VIRTLSVGSDPRVELKNRLAHLQDVELPRLRSEKGELGHMGTAALRDYARREVQDAARLLAELEGSLQLVPDARVQLNDSVVLHEESEGEAEEFIVHAPGLIVKAPGFISAETALGSAVLGKQAGDVVRVETPRSRRTFVVQAVRRWSL
jgi:transcription elongation GreA/GreB family factor